MGRKLNVKDLLWRRSPGTQAQKSTLQSDIDNIQRQITQREDVIVRRAAEWWNTINPAYGVSMRTLCEDAFSGQTSSTTPSDAVEVRYTIMVQAKMVVECRDLLIELEEARKLLLGRQPASVDARKYNQTRASNEVKRFEKDFAVTLPAFA